MNLVEEYLRAVGAQLARAGREDILAELRDLVLTRIEAREAELGRRLSDDEVEAVLREVGHPLVVAARYGSGPQHAVGPAVYPFWLFGVKAALAIAGALICLNLLVRIGVGEWPWHAIPHAVNGAVQTGLVIVGAATVGAWMVERRYVKAPALDAWRVKDLGVLRLGGWDLDGWREQVRGWSRSREPSRPRATAGDALGNIAFGALFLLWWAGVLHLFNGGAQDWREVGIEPGALAGFDWAGLKAMVLAPGLLYGAAVLGQGLYMLARPYDLRTRGLINLATGAGVIAIAAWLMWASPLAPQVAVGSVAELVSRVRAAFEDGAPFELAGVITTVLAVSMFGGAMRMLRGLQLLVAPQLLTPPAVTASV